MIMFIPITLLWALSFQAFATDFPARIDINYSVKTGIGSGELIESMKIEQDSNANKYHITSEAKPSGVFKLIKPGSIQRNSWGNITKTGLQPTRFTDQRNNKQPSVATFDWNNHLLTLQHESDQEEKNLPVGTLDRLSFSYNFMFSPPSGKSINTHITDGRSLELVRYVIDEEILETPIGELKTTVLTMQQENSQLKRKIWLATTHHMLPVRIVAVEKDGLKIEKMVTKIDLK